ncbi:CPBP family intramembrane glutamic endopeptidase [Rhizobium herbae]|uniref:Membrane protease YdiL (CAAX protease family) n=1 Tax=Rhizobium herbae TaxID=508661 RepID=A0ABS4ERK3_9HYPH|nr:CPBP family intramembrane glutamic endopeptidase [Rhizobium herbae]MBP1860579.1 membrane protease YdiL (CAAX protease family) [Rhizobium herbae]
MGIFNNRLGLSLMVLTIWTAITIVGGAISAGFNGSTADPLTHGVHTAFVAAIVFLTGVAFICRWSDLGFNAPVSVRSLSLLWLPLVYIAFFCCVMVLFGLPAPGVIASIFINTLLIGMSEELMFRGILFKALRSCCSIRSTVWISSPLFGAVHLLNGFSTGFSAAIPQAIFTFGLGILFIAIRIRTGSLYPVIALHAAWDFCIFTLDVGPAGQLWSAAELYALASVLPLYGLYLLRKSRAEPSSGDVA